MKKFTIDGRTITLLDGETPWQAICRTTQEDKDNEELDRFFSTALGLTEAAILSPRDCPLRSTTRRRRGFQTPRAVSPQDGPTPPTA